MFITPFTGRGSTPNRRKFWRDITRAANTIQKLAGKNVTVEEQRNKGTVISIPQDARSRGGSVTPPATGACCIGETCSIRTRASCEAAGGSYQGDGTTCTPNPCVNCDGRLFSLVLDLIGIFCVTDPSDVGRTSVFHFAIGGMTGLTLPIHVSGTTSAGGDGSTLDWYIDVVADSTTTFAATYGGTISRAGSSGNETFVFSASDLSCDGLHVITRNNNFCATCHDCSSSEPGYRCTSALCGSPYGCCQHLLLFDSLVGGHARLSIS
jgi:hypothetical protein